MLFQSCFPVFCLYQACKMLDLILDLAQCYDSSIVLILYTHLDIVIDVIIILAVACMFIIQHYYGCIV